MPPGGWDAWAAFLDLDRWRGVGMTGLAPLTLHDVDAYERRYGVALDADLMKRLDFARLAAVRDPKEKP